MMARMLPSLSLNQGRKRDGKGLYARFAQGRVSGVPGEDIRPRRFATVSDGPRRH